MTLQLLYTVISLYQPYLFAVSYAGYLKEYRGNSRMCIKNWQSMFNNKQLWCAYIF